MGYFRSRAKCVPLQYPTSATRGVKQALKEPHLKQNLIVLSTPLQEINKSSDIKESPDQVLQSESGMFDELSNRKSMKCEKYQDCSWFQQSSVCNNKLSLVETLDTFTDADEFNLPMQCTDAQMPQWEREYLDEFTDDYLFDENYKLEEKNNKDHMDIYAAVENFDLSNNVNFTLKKTDSVDSMKNISLTNPADIIPISYKEKVNNSNYSLIKLDDIKSEVKEEVEVYSPDSNLYKLDSDDSDLNIGREEEVEEIDFNENDNKTIVLSNKKASVDSCEITSQIFPNQKVVEMKDDSFVPAKQNGVSQTTSEKFDLNLDISKLNFEPSLNVNTPDLDFMDLVEFINEEMRQEKVASAGTPKSTSEKISSETPISEQALVSSKNINTEVNESQSSHALTKVEECKSSSSVTPSNNSNSDSGISIAERIKTFPKRKTRKSVQEIIESEEEDDGDFSESLDEDEDYDYREELSKRRRTLVQKRARLNLSENSSEKKDVDSSYRERRDKNNEASRRSRQNRKAREKQMFEMLDMEERRNLQLKTEADVLEKQVTSLRQLLLHVVLHKGKDSAT